MAKLYFRYGAMNSGKSTALMQVAHNYEEQGMRVLILKPQIDSKGGGELVSRLGVRRKADLLIQPLCGVLATDYDKILIGTPSLPVPVPDSSISLVIPEIALFQKYDRYGYGRFSFNILEARTRIPVTRLSGVTTKATYTDWIVLLIPFSTTNISENAAPPKEELL